MARERSEGPGRRGRKVRVDLRKNREKTSRNKTKWTRSYRDRTIEHEDAATGEHVRARGDLSRKRTVIVHEEGEAPAERLSGVVVCMRGLIAEVDDGRQHWACTVRRMLRTRQIDERHPIAVGDRVAFTPVALAGEQSRLVSEERELPEGVIEDVEPRTTTLVRHYDRRLQTVAANVDMALIVVSADQPTLRPHLIDRYLVAAHQGDMRPVICLNKMDLDADGVAAGVAERYRAIGYVVHPTSVTGNVGLDGLREELRARTTVLVGASGVGKSSLLNALDPNLALRIGSLTDLQRGRHTTTTASLLRWAFGGYVVDTPGMRQFDIAEIEPSELEAYFPEFRELVAKCRFPNCSHTHEAECAIKAEVEEGRVFPDRYQSYVKMRAECEEKKRQRYA